MKKLSTVSLLITAALFSGSAHAEFSFLCGEGREKGVESSELALVDSPEAAIKFYQNGKEVPDEKTGIKPLDGGKWNVSVDNGPGKGTTKFEFKEKSATVQEYAVDDAGKEKKVGSKKKCEFTQKD